MSMLRNWLTYMGLGPDEDYDDRYLYDPDGSEDADDVESSSPARPTQRTGAGGRSANYSSGVASAARSRSTGRGGASGHHRTAESNRGADRQSDEVDLRDRPGPADYDHHSPSTESGPARGERRAGSRPASRERGAVRQLRPVPDSGFDLDHRSDVRPFEDSARRSGRRLESGQYVKPRLLAPRSFGDAKTLADDFKQSVPVLMNLQGVDRDLARRLIDFASGVCYGMDGSMEKVASSVFLLTPSSVEVSAEDRQKIEQRDYRVSR